MNNDADRELLPESKPDIILPAGILKYSTEKLMAGAREIIIEHEGREYRLRITQLGKLILTR